LPRRSVCAGPRDGTARVDLGQRSRIPRSPRPAWPSRGRPRPRTLRGAAVIAVEVTSSTTVRVVGFACRGKRTNGRSGRRSVPPVLAPAPVFRRTLGPPRSRATSCAPLNRCPAPETACVVEARDRSTGGAVDRVPTAGRRRGMIAFGLRWPKTFSAAGIVRETDLAVDVQPSARVAQFSARYWRPEIDNRKRRSWVVGSMRKAEQSCSVPCRTPCGTLEANCHQCAARARTILRPSGIPSRSCNRSWPIDVAQTRRRS